MRLSAENAKLRDDLAKERKYNELTRDSIIHDIEKVVDDTMRLEEKTQAKLKVFEQEVAARARQLALSTSLVAVGKYVYSIQKMGDPLPDFLMWLCVLVIMPFSVNHLQVNLIFHPINSSKSFSSTLFE